MTNNEKIQRAEQLIAEANVLLSEVKKASNDEEDMIAKYKNDYCKSKLYFLDGQSKVNFRRTGSDFEEFERHHLSPYQHYFTEELAEQAKKLKDFNDKLLAFKYCYDLDYKPDFSDCLNRAYYVYYDSELDMYDYALEEQKNNLVYFSSVEIAQKCCDWLNSLK